MKKKLLFILLVGVCLLCSSCGTAQCYDKMVYDYQDYYYYRGHLITTPHYIVYPRYYRVYPRYYKIYPRYSSRPYNPHPPRILYPDPKHRNRKSSHPVYYDPKPSHPSPHPKIHKPNRPASDRKRSSAAEQRKK